MQSIGIIGCGNLSRAIVVPFAQTNHEINFHCYTPSLTRATELAKIINGSATDNASELKNLDCYLIACKPQQFQEMAQSFKKIITKDALIISVMAGIEIDQIKDVFDNQNIARLMPNTGSLYKKGVTLLYCDKEISKSHREFTEAFASCFSKVYQMESEKQLDELTVFTGSGPGILFEIFLNMSKSMMKYNLSKEQAQEMIKQTVLSTAALLENSNYLMSELRDQVTSKKGITEAAIMKSNELTNNEKLFDEIFKAGVSRGIELKK